MPILWRCPCHRGWEHINSGSLGHPVRKTVCCKLFSLMEVPTTNAILCWANRHRQFKGFLYPEHECNMKGQVAEISCSQVHITGGFIWNFLWHITISEFNTKHCLSFNDIKNLKVERLIKKLWCENKDHPWSICWCLPSVGGDIISVCLQHSC